MKRAFTVVEILIVCVLVAVVLYALFGFLSTTRRMNDASRGSAAVAGALLIEETIASDMRQLGVDPKRARVLELSRDGLSFYRTVFDGPAIRLRPVSYAVVRLKSGNAQLARTELVRGKPVRTVLDGILSDVTFTTTTDRAHGVTYLKVGLTVLPDDVPPGSGIDPHGVSQVLLARIPVPVQIVNPELESTCQILPEADLVMPGAID